MPGESWYLQPLRHRTRDGTFWHRFAHRKTSILGLLIGKPGELELACSYEGGAGQTPIPRFISRPDLGIVI